MARPGSSHISQVAVAEGTGGREEEGARAAATSHRLQCLEAQGAREERAGLRQQPHFTGCSI